MAWIGGVTGGTAAATAAAARRREEQREEETMTLYSIEDLQDHWEFKIVRAEGPRFRDSQKLREMLEVEARAGWQFLEKLDDSRVRLKRPASARQQDAYLPQDLDPYRTNYGTRAALVAAMIGLSVMLVLALFLFLLFTNS